MSCHLCQQEIMYMNGNGSEIARLMEQIDREIEALQFLKNGLVKCASHEMIMNRYRSLDRCYEQLAQQVGPDKAIDEICERMNAVL